MRKKLTLFLILFAPILYGQNENPLEPCPSSPNCVCTYGEKASKNLSPLVFKGSKINSKKELKILISAMKGAKLTEETENYLHIEFTTKLGKFVDDVEFYFDEEQKRIHYRSASRLGYGDFGANKRRMKRISKNWSV